MSLAQRFSKGVEFVYQNVTWIVTRLIPDQQLVVYENALTGDTYSKPHGELVNALFSGELSFVIETRQSKNKDGLRIQNLPEERIVDLSDYSPTHIAIAKFQLDVITPLLFLKPSERTEEIVDNRVAEIRQKLADAQDDSQKPFRVSQRSVYRWLKSYEASGKNISALIPNFEQCGNKGGCRLEIELRNLVDGVINDNCFGREKYSLDQLQALIANRVEEENRFRPLNDQLTIPARETIMRRIETFDIADRIKARRGKWVATRILAQHKKTPYPELPLARTEFDHTKTDLMVIDEEDNLPIGRLTLSFLLDSFTKYPLGYYLGFEPPSYYAVMECLYHAISQKPDLRELYGTENEWLAYGVPNMIVADNGKEMIGNDLADACLSLKIVLDKAPVKTPEFKGGVERIFGTLNTGLFHTLSGTTFSNFIEKGDYNSQKLACVSAGEVEKALNIFIVDYYCQKYHRGLNGIPARRWEAAMENNFFPRLPSSKDTLKILLGRVDYRTIKDTGIVYNRLRYNCGELLDIRLRLKGEQVKFKYHPGDLSMIHVYDPFEKRYIDVPSLDEEYTKGMSLWKHRVVLKLANQEAEEVNLAALGKALKKIQDVVGRAKDRQKISSRSTIARWETGGKPPSSRTIETAEETHPKALLPVKSSNGESKNLPSQSDVVTKKYESPTNNEAWEIGYGFSNSQKQEN